jgi:CRISPR-associated protein Csm2
MAQHTLGQFRSSPRGSSQGGESQRLNVSPIVFGAIDPKLYSDIAEETAKAVGQGGGRDRNKPSQLRRFYDELVALQDKVGRDKERFGQHQPFIQMLKAKVAYAQGRGKVDANFVSLLGRVVDQADDPDKLKQARLFMEAFMAFYKVHGPREG